MSAYRLGIDIGGTFTDGVVIDEKTGEMSIEKVLTTPADPSEGFLLAAQGLVPQHRTEARVLRYIIHATTVATNAVLERRGAPAGLLVTEGFRDVLEIGRQVRHELYNLQTEKAPPLIAREHCYGIPERLDHLGHVTQELDEAAVANAVARLLADGIDSIAICFLHSYRNPGHEQRAGEIARAGHPAATISLSSEIAPEIREYWRASTTAINAYVAPLVRRYLDAVETRLSTAGFEPRVHVMQSSGGLMTAERARERPILMLESGPAAGVIAAAHFAQLEGSSNAISFDMGGTTAKVGLILDGRPTVLTEFEAGAVAGSGTGLQRGSGYPVLSPVIDLVEVGAGGGSIAWVDTGGLLRVGPTSAGADPGPACYARGGKEPTVTDANLVLGRLNPDYFLGGRLKLSRDAAVSAIESRCAEPLGIDTLAAAQGVVEIANATMVQAMRLVSVQRGLDPREFVLVCTGGAGPVHADQLARKLGVPTVLVPPSPGVASAIGMLMTNLRHDFSATLLLDAETADVRQLRLVFEGFEDQARRALAGDGVSADQIRLERQFDMRYAGQTWTLPVPLPTGDITAAAIQTTRETFDNLHRRSYGYAVPDETVEIVNARLAATGLISRPQLREVPRGDTNPGRAQKAVRLVHFEDLGGVAKCPIYNRYELYVGNVVSGPAVVEEMDSSTLIGPGRRAEVRPYGVLLIGPA
jgi:N-methylhydantoinase A